MRLIRLPRCMLPSVAFNRRHNLPKSSGVYYVMQGWSILYIGLSKNINTRWTSESKPHHKLGVFYGKPAIRIHYKLLPVELIGNFEAVEIKRYKPPQNARLEPIIPSAAWTIYSIKCWVLDSFAIAGLLSPLLFLLRF